MPDYLFIVNPASDRWRSGKRWGRLEKLLQAYRVNYEVLLTAGPGHAMTIAEEAAQSGRYGIIVAGGGDGTLNEVVNGLCRAADDGETMPLGIFPIGSGNDFAGVLGIPRDPDGMVRHLLEGKRRLVDVGLVHSYDMLGPTTPRRYFLNNCGIGFEAQVNLESRRIQRLQGFFIYLVAVFRALVRYRQPHVTLRWDGRERSERMLLVTVGNGRRAGGGFWLTPFAEVDDGLLEIGMARAMSRLEVLRLLPKAITGKHIFDPAYSLDRGAHLSVNTDIPVPVHTDGEAIIEGTRELEIRVIPRKVWVVSDPHRPLRQVLKEKDLARWQQLHASTE